MPYETYTKQEILKGWNSLGINRIVCTANCGGWVLSLATVPRHKLHIQKKLSLMTVVVNPYLKPPSDIISFGWGGGSVWSAHIIISFSLPCGVAHEEP